MIARLLALLPADQGFRRNLAFVYAVLAVLNLGGWAWALALFHDRPAMLGVALLVYGLGLRHAVDADHIAAIDNVTRKLIQERQQPVAVGFWFAIGHSAVVVLVTAAVIAAASNFEALEEFRDVGGTFSTCVSALFLLVVAGMNLMILATILRTLRRVRDGEAMEDGALDLMFAGRGPLSRLFRPLFACISRSWHMAPLGFLFGLSFDTATEVTLFGLSATQAGQGVPIGAALVFPVLFAAGMSLLDTTDGVMMVGAYRWAFVKPLRKLYYNMTITLMSIAVALFIGGVEMVALAVRRLGLEGPAARWAIALNENFNALGFAIIGVFAGAWGLSYLIFRSVEHRRLAA
ncbi:HoxN/HupN/NixA family nickel/cobalt transporter [Sphingomonas sp. S2-65]|uniref:HoxN/HupN/NixA family nickel/cobalt transporter n=1 Tax=Sphingomonas sp. S2-65 TaxID=2903960 RepID=UPI001F454492|nr:HoxN/HupN/NixA family nickel/cobalt transporter [Sphingomonas sp. S2-65]UYY58029.1 HoxN/HupN/NixA family nickel/cobalt transporter [Sphingomonas sp. S2-65]